MTPEAPVSKILLVNFSTHPNGDYLDKNNDEGEQGMEEDMKMSRSNNSG